SGPRQVGKFGLVDWSRGRSRRRRKGWHCELRVLGLRRSHGILPSRLDRLPLLGGRLTADDQHLPRRIDVDVGREVRRQPKFRGRRELREQARINGSIKRQLVLRQAAIAQLPLEQPSRWIEERVEYVFKTGL